MGLGDPAILDEGTWFRPPGAAPAGCEGNRWKSNPQQQPLVGMLMYAIRHENSGMLRAIDAPNSFCVNRSGMRWPELAAMLEARSAAVIIYHR